MPDWRGYVRGRLPPLACPPEREAEIVEEVAQQLQDIYAGALRAGASAAEAEARVRDEIHDWRALARDLQHAEQPILAAPKTMAVHRLEPAMHRFSVGLRLLEVLRDARLSVRALMARPLFTLTTVMTFALGIGATTVVFSLVHSVLLSPLPYREPDRLDLRPAGDSGDRRPRADPRRQPAVVHVLGTGLPDDLRADGGARRIEVDADRAWASPKGSSARRSRRHCSTCSGSRRCSGGPSPETRMRRAGTASRSSRHGFWQRRLAGDPAVIGRVLTLDSVPVEIVGVLPATFRLPQLPQLSVPNRVDNPFELFRPLAWSDAPAPVVGRVRQRGHRSAASRSVRSGN